MALTVVSSAVLFASNGHAKGAGDTGISGSATFGSGWLCFGISESVLRLSPWSCLSHEYVAGVSAFHGCLAKTETVPSNLDSLEIFCTYRCISRARVVSSFGGDVRAVCDPCLGVAWCVGLR